jgi:hypothetical protein
MALRMVNVAATMAPGSVIGVVGKTLQHSKDLIVLVKKLAAEMDVNLSHVTFKAIDIEKTTKANNE